jgi:hypothetical protein
MVMESLGLMGSGVAHAFCADSLEVNKLMAKSVKMNFFMFLLFTGVG